MAIAGLVNRNHANWVSQISFSGSSSISSSTIVIDDYSTGTIRTRITGTDLTDPIQMILINEFGNSLGFLSLLKILLISSEKFKLLNRSSAKFVMHFFYRKWKSRGSGRG